MTDMRATERLLEAIDECAMEIELGRPVEFPARHIREAIAELRRRGDTLVRRDDLREVIEHAKENADEYHTDWAGRRFDDPRGPIRDHPVFAALDRLQTQIGGTL